LSDRVEVCPASALPPGERKLTEVGGREVGVFNVDGTLYAIENTCPHYGGPVCEGQITPTIVADWPGSGERIRERLGEEPAIACPWHGWEFDMASGVHLGDDRYAVGSYDVVVEDDVVYVETGR